METGDLEFEHYLAERLGMTVARLRREVSQAEFMAWSVYYARKGQRMELERKKARSRGRA